MDFVSIILLLAIFAVVGVYFYHEWISNKFYPPGPTKFPLIGNALQIGGFTSHVHITKLHDKYGPILGAKWGPIRMVILSDAKLVREAFANPVFAGKADFETFHIMAGGKYGILSSDGQVWEEQRRFTIRQLRDLGFGKSYMEDLIMEEVNEFIAWLKTEEGMPISLEKRFSMAVLNSIWMLLHGHRYKHDDPRLQDLFQRNHDAGEATVKAGVLFMVPWIAKTIPEFSGYNKMMTMIQAFRSFFAESIKEHQDVLQEEGQPRDLVEAYLMEMSKEEFNTSSSFNAAFGMKNLMAMITDMFIAGHETTSSTLQWFILYVTRDEGIQEKIHKELDRVVGKSRRPTLGDKAELVYMEAVLLETLRISSIAPLGAPHEVMEDMDFHGYKLQKGCLITPNIWAIHHNPINWPNPDEFIPERFLSADGKSLLKNHENFIPFSVGKRACVGELMARNELFLFATNICHRFNITFDPNLPIPSTTEIGPSFILSPLPFKVVMTERLK